MFGSLYLPVGLQAGEKAWLSIEQDSRQDLVGMKRAGLDGPHCQRATG